MSSMKDVIPTTIEAPPEKVYEIITDVERIRIWTSQTGLPLVNHELPTEKTLQIGSVVKIKTLTWTFLPQVVLLRDNLVKWEFKDGPIKGTESWVIEPTDNGCTITEIMEYEVPKLLDRFLWKLFGRRLHTFGTVREFRTIKHLAEKDV